MEENMTKQRLTIRIGNSTLSFSAVDETAPAAVIATFEDATSPIIRFEPFVVKSGVSMAANLRNAFRQVELAQLPIAKVRVLIDSPVLMIPVELFEESKLPDLYRHSFPDSDQETVHYNVLPDLNAVAAFSVNKDLNTVIEDRFKNANIIAAISPVWRHLHQRSFTGVRNKLYGYFHEGRLDILSFQQHRFKFCNQYAVRHGHDVVYFLLYVWNQLALNAEHDELHLVGDLPEGEWLVEELKKYVSKVYVINPQADFNKAPATLIQGMPYDLMTLYVKGR